MRSAAVCAASGGSVQFRSWEQAGIPLLLAPLSLRTISERLG